MPSKGLNVTLYQWDPELQAGLLNDSSQQPHAIGSMIPILQMRKGLESLVRLPKVRSCNQTWMCLISELVSWLKLHREGNGKYGRFLVDSVSFCKDENQITSLDLRGPLRSIISAPWNILYSNRVEADFGMHARWSISIPNCLEVSGEACKMSSVVKLSPPQITRENQRMLKLEETWTCSHPQVYSLPFSTLFSFLGSWHFLCLLIDPTLPKLTRLIYSFWNVFASLLVNVIL